MSDPVDDRSKRNAPDNFHKTLSKAEFQRRTEARHKRLAQAVIIKEKAYSKAREEWPEKIAAIEAEEKLIAQWHENHRRKKRFSKRRDEEIYPWGQRISPTRYSVILQKRREKLQLRLETVRQKYEDAVLKLQSQIGSIRESFAWLEKNPAKIKAKRNLLNGHEYAHFMCTDDREHIVIKSVHVERASGSSSEEIISDDQDEFVVFDPCECRGIRELAGVREPAFSRTDALLGGGVSQANSFRLVGKTGDHQYLKGSINYHFFGSTGAPESGQVAPRFNDDNYRHDRREITDSYLENALTSGAVMARLESFAKASFEGTGEPLLSENGESLPQPLCSRRAYAQPDLAGFYLVGDIVSDGELKVQPDLIEPDQQPHSIRSKYIDPRSPPFTSNIIRRRCNPSSWKFYNDELRRALLTIDAGRSFIIEGPTGSGKTEMIPQMVNYCLSNGKTVKVMAGTDTLDVIEKRCHAFMTERIRDTFPIGWAREERYLIFGPNPGSGERSGAADTFSVLNRPFVKGDFIRPPGDLADVLIIDDASRLSFEISLYNSPFQLVILGDPAQINCHNSVFDVARASGFSTLHLRKNYRATNRDIMTWSNIFSYDNGLDMQGRGKRLSELHYMALGSKLNGVNRAEVRALVNTAQRLSSKRASLGVVAFSPKQLNAIKAALQKAGMRELAFVGLPEDVQGMQADYVLVSLNVALTPTGRLPLEIEGLEDEQCIAKMNVALSRARWTTNIFSGLLATDIDLRTATDAQALIASVLQTFEQLPTQNMLTRSQDYWFQ
ncbi:DEAD/DEAH box helicase family protein [Brucella thiophenivorans]|uniref:Viral (Super1) RNA helicase family protein n=1 Tax=Brucella thiophenivorans TaxID=571255 RepID=A0A256G877_9HYPH|nr:hypothetical protein [Brucella thiophenivorans]OYR23303.1 viral (Super1) RNA helicase family protein [Brucella thiophenivorans]